MKNFFLLLTAIVLTSSCATYKVKNLNENLQKTNYENIEFVNNIEAYSSKEEVGEFKVVDFEKEWSEIRPKIIGLAKENHANAIVVEKFEMIGSVVNGKLYQVSTTEMGADNTADNDRNLYIFRDELGSALTTHFKTELTVNGNTGKLKDKTFQVIPLNDGQDLIEIEINGKSKALELTEGNNYYWISRQINANQFGGTGLSIEIGGQKIKKLSDTEMGKIWVSTLK